MCVCICMCVCVCICVCVCVCVCVKMKRECQTNGKHDKRKSQAQWKENYRTGRGPFRQSSHCHPDKRKRERLSTKSTHVTVYLFRDLDRDRSRLLWMTVGPKGQYSAKRRTCKRSLGVVCLGAGWTPTHHWSFTRKGTYNRSFCFQRTSLSVYSYAHVLGYLQFPSYLCKSDWYGAVARQWLLQIQGKCRWCHCTCSGQQIYVQLGPVNLTDWRHLMQVWFTWITDRLSRNVRSRPHLISLKQVWSVSSASQFHCPKLYKTGRGFASALLCYFASRTQSRPD